MRRTISGLEVWRSCSSLPKMAPSSPHHAKQHSPTNRASREQHLGWAYNKQSSKQGVSAKSRQRRKQTC